jgi:hypothetical protein
MVPIVSVTSLIRLVPENGSAQSEISAIPAKIANFSRTEAFGRVLNLASSPCTF